MKAILCFVVAGVTLILGTVSVGQEIHPDQACLCNYGPVTLTDATCSDFDMSECSVFEFTPTCTCTYTVTVRLECPGGCSTKCVASAEIEPSLCGWIHQGGQGCQFSETCTLTSGVTYHLYVCLTHAGGATCADCTGCQAWAQIQIGG